MCLQLAEDLLRDDNTLHSGEVVAPSHEANVELEPVCHVVLGVLRRAHLSEHADEGPSHGHTFDLAVRLPTQLQLEETLNETVLDAIREVAIQLDSVIGRHQVFRFHSLLMLPMVFCLCH